MALLCGGAAFGYEAQNNFENRQKIFKNKHESDEEDIDYDYTSKWEYLGKGIWENQVKLKMKNSYVVCSRV